MRAVGVASRSRILLGQTVSYYYRASATFGAGLPLPMAPRACTSRRRAAKMGERNRFRNLPK